MRLFLDANVLFTAAYSPEGRSAALFELARDGRCHLLSSQHAIDEARRNICLKAPAATARLTALLEVVETCPEGDPRLVAWAAAHGLPAGDAPILAAAVAAGAGGLVTGDRRHFGQLLGRVMGPLTVLLPADALALLLD